MTNNESNIFNNNFCFSKVLKDIDYRIKFKNFIEEKSLYILKQLQKEKKEKRLLYNKMKNHNEIIHSLQKANEENELLLNYKSNKNLTRNLSQINSYLNKNNFNLPKLSNKEEDKNKIIIFEKIWKEQCLNIIKSNKNKRNNSNKTMYNNNYIVDIFDESYDKLKKEKEKKTQKTMLLDKIKNNNLKIKKKLKIHQDIMSKFKDKREYIPNYNAIEKHQPIVNLNTKSQRIFPIQFIKINSVGLLTNKEKKNESISKRLLKKNNSNKSFLHNNLSTCTLFKDYFNINNNITDKNTLRDNTQKTKKDNTLIKRIDNKKRNMIRLINKM